MASRRASRYTVGSDFARRSMWIEANEPILEAVTVF
jgi:hypothetical protein